ncbi:MAG: phosphorylase [Prochloron sp. SP5CPC1]|nr:phosphorylase [Candidatus Paraprochloron terpiosi SP5CPC1]
MTEPIQTILVPQGAEYQAVIRALSQTHGVKPVVLPIPVGMKAVTSYLEKWHKTKEVVPQRAIVMGLCGSLSSQYTIGDIVVYRDCVYGEFNYSPDPFLTNLVSDKLKARVREVRALTSDRLIWSSTEKARLGTIYNSSVVDMEGYAVLEVLGKIGVAVTMVRVISDNCYGNIPDLNSAISTSGKLETLPLVYAMVRQPVAAVRLIRGALKGLKVLEQVTIDLFSQ